MKVLKRDIFELLVEFALLAVTEATGSSGVNASTDAYDTAFAVATVSSSVNDTKRTTSSTDAMYNDTTVIAAATGSSSVNAAKTTASSTDAVYNGTTVTDATEFSSVNAAKTTTSRPSTDAAYDDTAVSSAFLTSHSDVLREDLQVSTAFGLLKIAPPPNRPTTYTSIPVIGLTVAFSIAVLLTVIVLFVASSKRTRNGPLPTATAPERQGLTQGDDDEVDRDYDAVGENRTLTSSILDEHASAYPCANLLHMKYFTEEDKEYLYPVDVFKDNYDRLTSLHRSVVNPHLMAV